MCHHTCPPQLGICRHSTCCSDCKFLIQDVMEYPISATIIWLPTYRYCPRYNLGHAEHIRPLTTPLPSQPTPPHPTPGPDCCLSVPGVWFAHSLAGIRRYAEDLTFRQRIDDFIQQNIQSVVNSKHFFGLPELKMEIIGEEGEGTVLKAPFGRLWSGRVECVGAVPRCFR